MALAPSRFPFPVLSEAILPIITTATLCEGSDLQLALYQRKSRLGYWRKIRGLTQQDLGRRLRVTTKTISNWELDITAPTREQAETLARLLRVNVRELFPFTAF
jgi:DNA-binding XRE family transcriptional regulator